MDTAFVLRSDAHADEARVQSRSGSMLGKNLAEHRKVAVMSQRQFSKRVFGEPRDGIVFVWRNVDRIPRPRFDQPDLHVERVGTNFLHGRTRRHRDVDAQLLSKLSSKCRAGQFPGLHVPTGQVPDVGIPTAPGRSVT
jgi:hypothetical protein